MIYLDSTTDGWSAIAGFIFFLIGAAFYFIPAFVAYGRHNTNAGAVLVIDIFLGWTLIGWIVALAMAAGGTTRDQAAARVYVAPPGPSTAAAPVISPDGRSWWDGTSWKPLPTAAPPPPESLPSSALPESSAPANSTGEGPP